MEQKELIIEMLKSIGENPDRPGLQKTPDRVVKMWKEIFRGYDITQKPKITTFNNGEDSLCYSQMITDEGSFYSYCEHHIIPFHGQYFFGYIAHSQGKILGLSKVARVVDYFSAKLQVQERLTHEIVDFLWKTLCDKKLCEHPPVGMALVMEDEHLCKTMRGAKKKGKMRTTVLKGCFKNDEKTRLEFFGWVNKNR